MRYFLKILNLVARWLPSRFNQQLVYGGALCGGVIAGAVLANIIGFGNQTLADAGYPEKEYMARPVDVISRGLRTGTQIVHLDERPTAQVRDIQPILNVPESGRPKIVIIFDDLGMDRAAYDRIRALPGPLTLSFLPYAPQLKEMAGLAIEEGHEVMLHLPMEPLKKTNDPGPGALLMSDTKQQFRQKLIANLDSFDGYVGVNNHMGSRLTANRASMQMTLRELKRRNLYFVDSVTTGRTVASEIAARIDVPIMTRDIFLDADHGEIGAPDIKARLTELERIASVRGYAIAIAHPSTLTMNTLEPWLLSVDLRGYELTTVTALNNRSSNSIQTQAALR